MVGEWHERRLGELTENFDSVRIPVKEADRRPGPYPYYGASGIVDSVDRYLFDGEYLLIAEDGENLRTRKTPVAFLARGQFWVNNHAHIVCGNAEADTRFLMYALAQTDIGGYLTGSTIPKLTQSAMNRIPVLTPPIDEQRAIAAILGTLDDKIELNLRMNETLESMARALFKSWFVDFDTVRSKAEGHDPFYAPELWSLFPSSLDPDDKPAGWHRGTLIDLCELKRGYDLPTGQRLPGPYPIVSSSGVSGSHSAAMANGPGVVTGRYGTIGDVYFINEAYWPLNTALYVRDFKGNSPRFVYYELLQVEFLQYSDKGAVPGINRNHLHQSPVVLPPRPLQQAFEKLLMPVWAKQECNSKETATLTALRDTLLPKLISGELRVKAAEKLVEAVA